MWLLIDNKPQDMNNIHPITLSNHELPHTSKYQYLGYIIHNNLTDDYIARLKISTFAQATILARQLHLCNPTIKHPQSIRYCATGFWCKLKKTVFEWYHFSYSSMEVPLYWNSQKLFILLQIGVCIYAVLTAGAVTTGKSINYPS